MNPIELTAEAGQAGKPLAHFWNFCVGAGRANEGLRADWQEQLALLKESCGFRYVRFHGLFHDDMFVYREEKGNPVYNFQYIDVLFDRLLALGVRPFVEFGFCPADLAGGEETIFWWKGHGVPPKDYPKWGDLIDHAVRHWIARYGIGEVRQWYFEVWNEPNLKPFFNGTRSQYFELYRVTATALKKIDSGLRVGGPATSNFVPDARFDGETEDTRCCQEVLTAQDLDALDWKPVWVEPFLRYCAEHELPLDFVSCHPYPTDWALDGHGDFKKTTRGVGATPRDLALLRKIVATSPYPNAEIHLTEWSSSSSPRDFTHDFLQAATYVVRVNLEAIGLVDSLSYWVFTDIFEEGGAGDTLFHGGFGMITLPGIVKPTFHAYRFLGELGEELLRQEPGGVVTRHRETGGVTALAYHYPEEMPLSVPASFDTRDKARQTLALGKPRELSLRVTGLAPGAAFAIELLEPGRGDALGLWEAMGSPEPLSRDQEATLREAAGQTWTGVAAADAAGTLSVRRTLAPWSVILVRQIVP